MYLTKKLALASLRNTTSIMEHVMLDIPSMFVSRASITAANVHHLTLGPEYWSEQKCKQAQGSVTLVAYKRASQRLIAFIND